MKKSITFSPFEKGSNSIDQLLSLFNDLNWGVSAIDSTYHKYHWPRIILTEENGKLALEIPDLNVYNENDYNQLDERNFDRDLEKEDEEIKVCDPEDEIDLLGAYIPRRGEGEIALYILRIEQTADKYSQYAKIPLEHAIESLSLVVLLHEISHWIVCSIKDSNGKRFRSLRYTNKEEVYFHEGLAQYFTWFILKKGFDSSNGENLAIFTWLEKRQKKQYQVFSEIAQFNIEDILAAIICLRNDKVQKWSELKKAILICSCFIGSTEAKALKKIGLREVLPFERIKLIDLIGKIEEKAVRPYFNNENFDELRGYSASREFMD